VGAALSTIDAATDIYVISTYFKSDALVGQAFALLAMISANLMIQIIVVLGQYVASPRERKRGEAMRLLFRFVASLLVGHSACSYRAYI